MLVLTRKPEQSLVFGENIIVTVLAIEGDRVTVYFHLTSPLCPSKFATRIGQEIRRRVEAVPGVGSCDVVLRDHFLRERIQQLINAGGR